MGGTTPYELSGIITIVDGNRGFSNYGLEGMVVVVVLIDETGKPVRTRIAKSVHEVLDKAAEEAVMKQRFEPGRQRNRAVRVEMAVPVRFQLTDAQ